MNFYLNKYGFQAPQPKTNPKLNLELIVVIPCFNEPDIISTLNSLECCESTKCSAEVIIVINSGVHHSETIKAQNKQTFQSIQAWQKTNGSQIDFHIIEANDLPKKHAGVGLARKIGMDEAVSRFHQIEHDGIIVCFDADSQCEPNYLSEIEKHFIKYPKTPGCAIRYEHPIEGNEFEQNIYDGIINYELFLRYYNQGLNFAKLPYAYHTVGSSMAIRSSAYQKQGGMNKRKAGEDFYFLHKIISLGNFTELNSTKVIPSPRTSDRVPFGTGKAINDWIETQSTDYLTYDFRIWELLKDFSELIPSLQDTDFNETSFYKEEKKQIFIQFLKDNLFENDLVEIRKNSTDQASFIKRFYVWFNAFRVLKLVHFLRDHQYPNQPIFNEAKKMAQIRGFYKDEDDLKTLLKRFRKEESSS